jgi:hypothetical protein
MTCSRVREPVQQPDWAVAVLKGRVARGRGACRTLRPLVGINEYQSKEVAAVELLDIDGTAMCTAQIERLKRARGPRCETLPRRILPLSYAKKTTSPPGDCRRTCRPRSSH